MSGKLDNDGLDVLIGSTLGQCKQSQRPSLGYTAGILERVALQYTLDLAKQERKRISRFVSLGMLCYLMAGLTLYALWSKGAFVALWPASLSLTSIGFSNTALLGMMVPVFVVFMAQRGLVLLSLFGHQRGGTALLKIS